MRLCIADPPYLGMGARYYGGGRGFGGGRGTVEPHPEADQWDDPATHTALLAYLVDSFDGWAVAMNVRSLAVYLPSAPPDVDVLVWHRGNSTPSGSSLHNLWEPVLLRRPEGRRGRADHGPVPDLFTAGHAKRGFVGRKPETWTRWVLAALGYRPAVDTVEDLFPGTGAVSAAAEGMLL